MIVKNEEAVLNRCLSSIKNLVDEIIIVDTGSTDNTKSIAKKFTEKVYNFKWCNNFSEARNYAFSLAKSSYIMWLDADDVVPTKTITQLKRLKPNLNADVYMLKYDIAFANNKPTFSYYRERIIKNCKQAKWQGVVHECIPPFGKIERLNLSILHKKMKYENSYRNLKIYENLLKIRTLIPREQYYYGRELFDHQQYEKCFNVLNDFVNSGNGWKENVIDALYLMYKCQKELNNSTKQLLCLFKTFAYDQPRANICCGIGDHFFLNKEYPTAIYWYNLATKCKDVSHNGGFVEKIYYNYYPYLQLCCCYYYLGDIKKATYYNNKAGKHINSIGVKNNKIFFEKLINN